MVTPGSGTASASRVAAAQGAPKRSGDDEGGGAERRVPWLSACPARGRCALGAPVSWPAGRVADRGGGLFSLTRPPLCQCQRVRNRWNLAVLGSCFWHKWFVPVSVTSVSEGESDEEE